MPVPIHLWWLPAGVVAMYLYDAVLLLYHNEVVFFERLDGRWSFSVGSDFELGGRHVYVPPLFSPTRPLLRLRWTSTAASRGVMPLRGLRAWRIAMRAMTARTALVACLFALMPLALQTIGLGLLAWLVALYASIMLAVFRAWRVRKASGSSRKDVAAISSDALLCAPFALDIIRKHGLKAADRFDLVAVAHALLDTGERARLAGAIRRRLEGQMAFEDVDGERHAQLRACSERIAGALA